MNGKQSFYKKDTTNRKLMVFYAENIMTGLRIFRPNNNLLETEMTLDEKKEQLMKG